MCKLTIIVPLLAIVGVVLQVCKIKITESDILLYILSNQKQPSCKKRCGPQKGHSEKRCEIQGGGQEMAVMVG